MSNGLKVDRRDPVRSFRMPTQDYRRVVEIAREQERSVAATIRYALKQYLDTNSGGHGDK